MNGLAATFLIANCIALLVLPRRWAPLPLIMGTCYLTLANLIMLGPLHFPAIRILITIGILRVMIRRERLLGGFNRLDWVMAMWSAWTMFAALFTGDFIGQTGSVVNTFGIYLLIRLFCQDIDDIVHLVKITAIVLAPLAIEMFTEQLSGRNLFSVFGGLSETLAIRGDRLRAQGPFAHSILAGTVGAAVLPMMFGLWTQHRRFAQIGLAACLIMVVSSASSGPLMSVIFGVFALFIWRWRHLTRQFRIAVIVGYILLDIVMKAPAYYLIARIDLTGGSNGWHRAEIIKQAIDHLGDWWLVGTKYTRHWMPYGVSWSADHCDITNQYIGYGVFGGLPRMLLFIMALWVGFCFVGEYLQRQKPDLAASWFAWTLGAALFAQAASCMSVFYFDQSFVFLFSNLGVIGSLHALDASPDTAMEDPATTDHDESVDAR